MRNGRKVRTVTVASGKGGVGKTNLVANLAVALRSMGKDVLILDADVGLSNVDVLLRLCPRHDISHVIAGEKTLNEVVIEGPHGIRILPAASGAQELTNLDASQRLRLLEAFGAYEGGPDVLLVDASAGISPNVAYFCVASQEIVVVTAPEPTALNGAYALIKVLATRYGEKRFGVVVNSARDDADADEAYRTLSAIAGGLLDVSLDDLGHIPLDVSVQDAARSQRPFIDMFPDGPASRKIRELAARFAERPGADVKGTLQFFVEDLLTAAEGAG